MAKQAKIESKKIKTKPTVQSAKSVAKYLRISPRKLRLVLDTVRYKPTSVAFSILANLKKKGARLAERVLKSAVANAKVLGMDEAKLYVAEIHADGGPMMKRFLPRSMGRADRILKRMAHLSLVVKEANRNLNRDVVSQETAKHEHDASSTKVAKKKVAAKSKAAKTAKVS